MVSRINEIAPWEAGPARVSPGGLTRSRAPLSRQALVGTFTLNGEISLDGAGRPGRGGA